MDRKQLFLGHSLLGSAAAVFLSLSLASAGWAATNVVYRVDQKIWKKSVLATAPLTFSLYSDAACSVAAAAPEVLFAGDTGIIYELPKTKKVKDGVKPPKTTVIHTVLSASGLSGPLFLEVTGTGIVPVGTSCQVQEPTAAPAAPDPDLAGVGWTEMLGCSLQIGTDTTVHSRGSVSITVPTSGYVVVQHTGHIVFGGDNRTMSIGIGTSAGSMTSGSTLNIGDLDGSGSGRYEVPYSTTDVFPVAAGTSTFYANFQGNDVFDSSNVNVCPRMLVAVFVPNLY
jgi:hypothetical protein